MFVDKDKSGEISYNEIITECSQVNCAYVLFKIQQWFEKNKSYTHEKIFDMFDRNGSKSMSVHEFNEMLNFIY